MSAFLTWRNEWQTGIDWIDEDHQKTVELLNQLVAISECASRDPYPQFPDAARREILATMDALIEHSRRHFRAEEAFLREIRFPGYSEHRCEHVLQLAEFTDLRRAMGEEGSPCVGPETLEEFKRWFFNHVVSEDRDYVDYYRGELGAGRGVGEDAAASH